MTINTSHTDDPAYKGTILYIEDNFENKLLVRRILEVGNYRVLEASNGMTGVQMAQEHQPDLIIMDLNLPGMDGYEAATRIKSITKCRNIPIVALTASVQMGDKERSLVAGCDGYMQKPIDLDNFIPQIEEYINGKVERIETASENIYLRQYSEQLVTRLETKILELEKSNKQLQLQSLQMEEVYVGVITSLMKALEAKHTYTAGHSERVTRYCMAITQEMRLPRQEVKILRRAARLHDIGKLVIELASIENPGSLSDEEWKKMRQHSEIGAQILGPLRFLEREIEVIRDHHERYDGKGYPLGKKGDEIPILAAILAVADSFDAMTSKRSYQSGLTEQQAMENLVEQKGKQFHPDVVDSFVTAWRRFRNE